VDLPVGAAQDQFHPVADADPDRLAVRAIVLGEDGWNSRSASLVVRPRATSRGRCHGQRRDEQR